MSLLGAVTANAQMSGTYTIGNGARFDYATPKDAAADLDQYGVDGPVLFLVENGIYNGEIKFYEITGASGKNSITFRGKSLDSSKVIFSNNGQYTFNFQGGEFVRVEHITVSSSRTNAAILAYMIGADSNRFSHCRFISKGITNGYYAVLMQFCDANEFRNCRFEKSYYAITNTGTTNSPNTRNTIDSSIFTGFSLNGVRNHSGYGLKIMRSQFNADPAALSSIYERYTKGTVIVGNEIFGAKVGINFYDCNDDTTNQKSSDTIRIINNTISSTTDYAIRMANTDLTTIYHNAVVSEDRAALYMSNSGYYRHRVANNIFYSDSANYGLYVVINGRPLYWDYNNYYFTNGKQGYARFDKFATDLASLKKAKKRI